MLDIAATVPPWMAEKALDAALRRDLTSIEDMEYIVDDLGRQGRRGVKLVRELVEERRQWTGTTESELEDSFRRLIQRSGLPGPCLQHQIADGSEFIGRVDFAYPDQQVAIELDGYSFHSDPSAFVRDRERQNRLLIAGYTVLRYTAKDLRQRPHEVVEEVRASLSVPVNRNRAQRG